MNKQNIKNLRRKQRIRKHIRAVSNRLRLLVFRSNMHLYAQIVDDSKNLTILSVSEKELGEAKVTKTQRATMLGAVLAKKAKDAKISEVVFDKGGYKYHGRIKAFAEEARKEGLIF